MNIYLVFLTVVFCGYLSQLPQTQAELRTKSSDDRADLSLPAARREPESVNVRRPKKIRYKQRPIQKLNEEPVEQTNESTTHSTERNAAVLTSPRQNQKFSNGSFNGSFESKTPVSEAKVVNSSSSENTDNIPDSTSLDEDENINKDEIFSPGDKDLKLEALQKELCFMRAVSMLLTVISYLHLPHFMYLYLGAVSAPHTKQRERKRQEEVLERIITSLERWYNLRTSEKRSSPVVLDSTPGIIGLFVQPLNSPTESTHADKKRGRNSVKRGTQQFSSDDMVRELYELQQMQKRFGLVTSALSTLSYILPYLPIITTAFNAHVGSSSKSNDGDKGKQRKLREKISEEIMKTLERWEIPSVRATCPEIIGLFVQPLNSPTESTHAGKTRGRSSVKRGTQQFSPDDVERVLSELQIQKRCRFVTSALSTLSYYLPYLPIITPILNALVGSSNNDDNNGKRKQRKLKKRVVEETLKFRERWDISAPNRRSKLSDTPTPTAQADKKRGRSSADDDLPQPVPTLTYVSPTLFPDNMHLGSIFSGIFLLLDDTRTPMTSHANRKRGHSSGKRGREQFSLDGIERKLNNLLTRLSFELSPVPTLIYISPPPFPRWETLPSTPPLPPLESKIFGLFLRVSDTQTAAGHADQKRGRLINPGKQKQFSLDGIERELKKLQMRQGWDLSSPPILALVCITWPTFSLLSTSIINALVGPSKPNEGKDKTRRTQRKIREKIVKEIISHLKILETAAASPKKSSHVFYDSNAVHKSPGIIGVLLPTSDSFQDEKKRGRSSGKTRSKDIGLTPLENRLRLWLNVEGGTDDGGYYNPWVVPQITGPYNPWFTPPISNPNQDSTKAEYLAPYNPWVPVQPASVPDTQTSNSGTGLFVNLDNWLHTTRMKRLKETSLDADDTRALNRNSGPIDGESNAEFVNPLDQSKEPWQIIWPAIYLNQNPPQRKEIFEPYYSWFRLPSIETGVIGSYIPWLSSPVNFANEDGESYSTKYLPYNPWVPAFDAIDHGEKSFDTDGVGSLKSRYNHRPPYYPIKDDPSPKISKRWTKLFNPWYNVRGRTYPSQNPTDTAPYNPWFQPPAIYPLDPPQNPVVRPFNPWFRPSFYPNLNPASAVFAEPFKPWLPISPVIYPDSLPPKAQTFSYSKPPFHFFAFVTPDVMYALESSDGADEILESMAENDDDLDISHISDSSEDIIYDYGSGTDMDVSQGSYEVDGSTENISGVDNDESTSQSSHEIDGSTENISEVDNDEVTSQGSHEIDGSTENISGVDNDEDTSQGSHAVDDIPENDSEMNTSQDNHDTPHGNVTENVLESDSEVVTSQADHATSNIPENVPESDSKANTSRSIVTVRDIAKNFAGSKRRVDTTVTTP